MNTVFLLGAGASFGSGACHPHCPPLGNGLFAELRRMNRTAATVEGPLREKFEEDFEAGMVDFFRQRGVDMSAFVRDMAAYFAHFTPTPGNCYIELADIVASVQGDVVISTLNYDLLLEYAFWMANHYKVAYRTYPDQPRNGFPILKLHGSCNFLPDTDRGASFQGISVDLNVSERLGNKPIEDLTGGIYDGPVKVVQGDEVIDFCMNNDTMAPALGIYAPGKLVLWGRSFVAEQQRMWREAVKKADKIYIIGARYYPRDTHIWDVLAASKGAIRYVSPDPAEFLEWRDNTGREGVDVIPKYFNEALPAIRKDLLGT